MLLGLALEQGILATFKHHSFDDQGVVRLQGEGGPIGLKRGRGRVEGGGGARVVCTEEGGRVESEVLGALGLNFPCGMMKCKIV